MDEQRTSQTHLWGKGKIEKVLPGELLLCSVTLRTSETEQTLGSSPELLGHG